MERGQKEKLLGLIGDDPLRCGVWCAVKGTTSGRETLSVIVFSYQMPKGTVESKADLKAIKMSTWDVVSQVITQHDVNRCRIS